MRQGKKHLGEESRSDEVRCGWKKSAMQEAMGKVKEVMNGRLV